MTSSLRRLFRTAFLVGASVSLLVLNVNPVFAGGRFP
jgi:hypothetical protein